MNIQRFTIIYSYSPGYFINIFNTINYKYMLNGFLNIIIYKYLINYYLTIC